MNEYCLYVDESGRFLETSTCPEESRQESGRIPSQLVGLVGKKPTLDQHSARRVLEEAFAAAGWKYENDFHAHELERKDNFAQMASSALQQLEDRAWFPVRIVNAERISAGTRLQNYTRVAGELVQNIFAWGEQHVGHDFALDCCFARVVNQQWGATAIEEKDYELSIRDALSQAAIAAERPERATLNRLTDVRIGSARSWPELQLCDLLSFLSYRDYRQLRALELTKWKKLFEDRDWTMQRRSALAPARRLLDADELGRAWIALIEGELASGEELERVRDMRMQLYHRCGQRLLELNARMRERQLGALFDHLSMIIDDQRELDLGQSWLAVVRKRVLKRLEKLKADPELNEAERLELNELLGDREFDLARFDLTLANHRGDTRAIGKAHEKLIELAPGMGRRLDRLDALIHAQLHEIVHLTDIRRFGEGRSKGEALVHALEGIGSLLPEIDPSLDAAPMDVLRAAECHGALAQLEAYASLADGELATFTDRDDCLDRAREHNDRALQLFASDTDRKRTMQYRSMIECFDDMPDLAAVWLAQSLGLIDESLDPQSVEPPSYRQLMAHILGEGTEHQSKPFALLHLSRILRQTVMMQGRPGYSSLRCDSELAMAHSAVSLPALASEAWLFDPDQHDYPAHSIRRNLTATMAVLEHPLAHKASQLLDQTWTKEQLSSPILATLRLATSRDLQCIRGWRPKLQLDPASLQPPTLDPEIFADFPELQATADALRNDETGWRMQT